MSASGLSSPRVTFEVCSADKGPELSLRWRWVRRWALVDMVSQTLLFGPSGLGDSRFPKWLRLPPPPISLYHSYVIINQRATECNQTHSQPHVGPIKVFSLNGFNLQQPHFLCLVYVPWLSFRASAGSKTTEWKTSLLTLLKRDVPSTFLFSTKIKSLPLPLYKRDRSSWESAGPTSKFLTPSFLSHFCLVKAAAGGIMSQAKKRLCYEQSGT